MMKFLVSNEEKYVMLNTPNLLIKVFFFFSLKMAAENIVDVSELHSIQISTKVTGVP